MGRGDNRRSDKMRRKKAQRRYKDRKRRNAEAARQTRGKKSGG